MLVLAVLVGVVVVVTRMSLDLHQETMDLLRLMGAPDGYVARQFEHHALSNALRGGLFGFTAAVMVISGFVVATAALPAGGLPPVDLRPLDWLLLGCVPVAAALSTAPRLAADGAPEPCARARSPLANPAAAPLSRSADRARGATTILSAAASPVQGLRALLFNLFLWTWTTVFSLAVLPAFPFLSPAAMRGVARGWERGIAAALRLLVGLTYEVRGRDRLPGGPAIIASKHQSAWETLVAPPAAAPTRRSRLKRGADADPAVRLVPDPRRHDPDRPRGAAARALRSLIEGSRARAGPRLRRS